MNRIRANPDEANDRCPDSDSVDRVLDREAPEEVAGELRRHVAGCPDCRERYGALFEVDSLAPAIARDGDRLRPTIAWRRVLLAAAALVVAATLVVFLRPRTERVPEISKLDGPRATPAPAPPRLVASRLVETEIVVDATGVRASIRRGGSSPGSFEFQSSRSGFTSCAWSPSPSAEKSR